MSGSEAAGSESAAHAEQESDGGGKSAITVTPCSQISLGSFNRSRRSSLTSCGVSQAPDSGGCWSAPDDDASRPVFWP